MTDAPSQEAREILAAELEALPQPAGWIHVARYLRKGGSVEGWPERDKAAIRAIDAALSRPAAASRLELDTYDVGLLPEPENETTDWWQDAMRAELARAHEFYQDQANGLAVPAAAVGREADRLRAAIAEWDKYQPDISTAKIVDQATELRDAADAILALIGGEGERVVDPTAYALSLLVEEMGEALCHIGRAGRFGIDTLGQDGISERVGLTRELGDIRGGIMFALAHELIDEAEVERAAMRKLAKLLDPESRDNLGRRLAPPPAAQGDG